MIGMAIKRGDFVRLNYTGEVDGKVFDTTDEAIAKDHGIRNPESVYGPFVIRVGSGHLISGLDEALEGKEVGVEYSIDLPPERGFGTRDESQIESIPATRFEKVPEIGSRIQIEGREGVVIDRIGKRGRIIVDFNHPLAGRTLHYRFRIEDRVDSPVEQIRGLIRLYAQREMEVEVEGNTAKITLPPGVVYDRRWLLWRRRIIDDILSFVDGIEHIVLLEHFHRPKANVESEGETREGENVSEDE